MKMMVGFLVHIIVQVNLAWLIFRDIYNLTFTQLFCGNIRYFEYVL